MIGSMVKCIFNFKASMIMKSAAKDPRFKSALEDYAKGAKEFRKKLHDYYGTSDIDKFPSI